MRIAVIGTGIAGLAAAYAISRRYPTTLYEREIRPGGHSYTVDVGTGRGRLPVDMGFIVYNERNYPNLTALFEHLGVTTQPSTMSFSLSRDGGAFEWKGSTDLRGLFAQPSNLLSPRFYGLIREILRFNHLAPRDRAAGALDAMPLRDWLRTRGFSQDFAANYLLPMAGAIWSMPPGDVLDFPARTLVAFFEHHRLTSVRQPRWRTVSGGSRVYVSALMGRLRGRVKLGTPVRAIERTQAGVRVTDAAGTADQFDHVVIATHSDQACALLKDATAEERATLGAIRFQPNIAILHGDTTLMPRRQAAWAAWNVLSVQKLSGEAPGPDAPVAVTYWMNLLQSLDPTRPLFVSLNPPREPDPALVHARAIFEHPIFDGAAIAAQGRLAALQERDRISFAGAWTGYGFHEDGITSGLRAAAALGALAPWLARPETLTEAAE